MTTNYIHKALFPLCFSVLWLVSLLPLRILYLLSDALYVFIYRVMKYRRATVRQNLTSAFPEKGHDEIVNIERDFYHWLCDYLAETIKMLTISRKEMCRRMVFKGTNVIDQMVFEGVSCGVMLGHYCNWEWITSLPLYVTPRAVCAELYHPLESSITDRTFRYIRQRFGSICIPMEETLRHIARYQKEQKPLVIGYIADQKPNWRNIHLWTMFLNHNTPVFTGSERIIKHTRQAFFYGDVRRIKRGYYECEFKLMERHSENIPDYQLTEMYMKELEHTIRREPALWLWSHNRWSRTKEEFDYRFYIKNGKVYEKVTESQYAQHMGWQSYWNH